MSGPCKTNIKPTGVVCVGPGVGEVGGSVVDGLYVVCVDDVGAVDVGGVGVDGLYVVCVDDVGAVDDGVDSVVVRFSGVLSSLRIVLSSGYFPKPQSPLKSSVSILHSITPPSPKLFAYSTCPIHRVNLFSV